MLLLVNDFHGNEALMQGLINYKFAPGDILVANGDFVGGRGPELEHLKEIFHNIRRGNSEKIMLERAVTELTGSPVFLSDYDIRNSVHVGMFFAKMCKEFPQIKDIVQLEEAGIIAKLREVSQKVRVSGGRFIYLAGNNEIAISDLDISDGIIAEKLCPPEQRLFNRYAKNGAFEEIGVEYINRATIKENTVFIPIDLIDSWDEVRNSFTVVYGVTDMIIHYPPQSETICSFFGYSPNPLDYKRMEAVSEIMTKYPALKRVIFGHIHRVITPEALAEFPCTKTFTDNAGRELIWNRPGNILPL